MTFNISELAAKGNTLDLMIADVRGQVKVTKLPTRKPRKSELIMSQTKGSRTNTNRRGQNYSGHAVNAQTAVTQGNRSAYFKTCLLYTSPSPRDVEESRMPSSA